MTTTPVTTEAVTWTPQPYELAGRAHEAITALATALSEHRSVDQGAAQRLGEEARWNARTMMAAEVDRELDRLDPEPSHRGLSMNGAAFDSEFPMPPEPTPASWRAALDRLHVAVDEHRAHMANSRELGRTAASTHALLLALVDPTRTGQFERIGVSDSGLTNVLAGFIDQVRVGLGIRDGDVSLADLGQAVIDGHNELEQLRGWWEQVPLAVRNAITGNTPAGADYLATFDQMTDVVEPEDDKPAVDPDTLGVDGSNPFPADTPAGA